MSGRFAAYSIWALMLLLFATPALRADNGDRIHFGQSITVGEDENAGDLVCIGCSIRMQGTCGDVVAIGGSIALDGKAKGDAVTIGGGIRMGENSSVDGDVVTMGGRLWRATNATVRGDVSQLGAPILALAMLTPLIPVVLIVALIVWLIRRDRPPAPVRG